MSNIHEIPPPDEIKQAAKVSRSTDAEVDALIRRGAPILEPSHRPQWLVPGGLALSLGAAAVMAAIILMFQLSTSSNSNLAVGSETTIEEAQRYQLGPSIELEGAGLLTVTNAGTGGNEVHIDEGSIRFFVDPKGTNRALRVQAKDVSVFVTGTVFVVSTDGDTVNVAVERGSVRVEHNGQSDSIGAGQSWTAMIATTEYSSSLPGLSLYSTLIESSIREALNPRPETSELKDSPAAAKSKSRMRRRFKEIDEGYARGLDARSLLLLTEQYLRSYPTSSYDERVRAYEIDFAREVEEPEQVIERIDAFLKRYPNSARRTGFQGLREALRHRR